MSIVLIIVDCRQRIHRILDRTIGRCPQQHHGIAGCCGIAATCAAGAVLHIIIIEIMGSRCAHIDAGLLIVSYCNCVGPGGNQYTDAVACGIHSGRTGKGSVADLNQLAVPQSVGASIQSNRHSQLHGLGRSDVPRPCQGVPYIAKRRILIGILNGSRYRSGISG